MNDYERKLAESYTYKSKDTSSLLGLLQEMTTADYKTRCACHDMITQEQSASNLKKLLASDGLYESLVSSGINLLTFALATWLYAYGCGFILLDKYIPIKRLECYSEQYAFNSLLKNVYKAL